MAAFNTTIMNTAARREAFYKAVVSELEWCCVVFCCAVVAVVCCVALGWRPVCTLVHTRNKRIAHESCWRTRKPTLKTGPTARARRDFVSYIHKRISEPSEPSERACAQTTERQTDIYTCAAAAAAAGAPAAYGTTTERPSEWWWRCVAVIGVAIACHLNAVHAQNVSPPPLLCCRHRRRRRLLPSALRFVPRHTI